MTKNCLGVFAFFGYIQASISLNPLVDTPQGLIRGLLAKDGNYSMFLGIPYAKINEDNPFGASLPHIRFDSIYNAYNDSAICPQMDQDNNIAIGTLDCLKLNVYLPHIEASKYKLPVLVWIYGGGFTVGFTGIYDPKYLVRHDVIVVAINYRVSTYGFLCLDIPEVSGNQGLKDQRLALRWIKNNIGAFGGDINKITLMGESAGAASVEFHILSKHERLFQKVIMQSGTALGHWAIVPSNRTVVFMIGKKLGFESVSLTDTLQFLSKIDPKLITAVTSELNLIYRPCVEKEFENAETFIYEHPEFSSANNRVSILAGYNSQEELGAILYDSNNNDLFRTLRSVFHLDPTSQMLNIIRQFYNEEKEINETYKWDAIDFSSDFNFNYPMQRSIIRHSQSSTKVYHYLFSYNGGRNYRKRILNITKGGAAHMDELGYLFDFPKLSSFSNEETAKDRTVIDRMTTMWTNFVKYGNPTPDVSELLPVKWTPITSDVLCYLHIDSELSMESRPFHKRLAFWDLFYKVNFHNMKIIRNFT